MEKRNQTSEDSTNLSSKLQMRFFQNELKCIDQTKVLFKFKTFTHFKDICSISPICNMTAFEIGSCGYNSTRNHFALYQRWTKIISFCQPCCMRQNVLPKMSDFQQILGDTKKQSLIKTVFILGGKCSP